MAFEIIEVDHVETEEERRAWLLAHQRALELKQELLRRSPHWHHWREPGGHIVSEK